MSNFWKKLKKPFFVLAPMDDVTDVVFRQVVTKLGKPDVLFTEFTNVDGLESPGREKLLGRFKFESNEHPIVAQIWGKDPDNFRKVAEGVKEMGFDGIDLNMGCPVKGPCNNGTCSALINDPKKAAEIIEATKQGAAGLPVSVKTRLGYSKIQTDEWIPHLLSQGIEVLTIHGRTRKEMSKVPAHWDEIKKVVEIRDKMGVDTLIVGNGDILNYEDGLKRAKESGVDGLMIGRGIFKDLWCFLPEDKKPDLGINEMLDLLLEHAELFIETWGEGKKFYTLRRFFKIYVNGFENAADLRAKLMETNNLEEVEGIIKDFKARV